MIRWVAESATFEVCVAFLFLQNVDCMIEEARGSSSAREKHGMRHSASDVVAHFKSQYVPDAFNMRPERCHCSTMSSQLCFFLPEWLLLFG